MLSVLCWGMALQALGGHRAVMSFGNAQPIVDALWGVALLGIQRLGLAPAHEARRLRGVIASALAVAILWKLQPIWAALVLARQEPRMRAPLLACALGYGLLGGLVCGWASYLDWWRHALPVVSQGTFDPGNVSLSFGLLRVARWLGLWSYHGGTLDAGARLLLSGLAVAAPASTWWATRRWGRGLLALRCAVVSGAAVLFAPLCWSSYLPLLLPAAILGARAGRLLVEPEG